MLFIVRFFDHPGSEVLRQQHLAAHIEWLDARRDSILVAGSLREEPGADALGGLWIVEAGSKQDVEALYRSDPFWTAGLRQAVEILHWSKAFADRTTPV